MTDSNSQKPSVPPMPQPQGTNIKSVPFGAQRPPMPAPISSNVVRGFDSIHPVHTLERTNSK